MLNAARPQYAEWKNLLVWNKANGGQGNWHSGARCMPPGMPATMNVYGEMEIVLESGGPVLCTIHAQERLDDVVEAEAGEPAA